MLNQFKLAVIGYARGHPFSSSGALSFLGRLFFPAISVRPKILKGLTVQLTPSDLSHLVAFDEVLIAGVYRLNEVPFTPDFVIDCGANIGAFTLLAAGAFPQTKIVAFEPDPENLVWLRKQVRANQLVQVEIVAAAVSDTDGETSFTAGLGVGSAITSTAMMSGTLITVKAVRLSEYLRGLKTRALVMKMDIEGAEEQVLPDVIGVLPAETAIFFETHGGDDSWHALSRILTEAGFVVEQQRVRGPYYEGRAVRTRES
jgi:FkbM family methyltransferase